MQKKRQRKGRTRQATPPKITLKQQRFVASFTDPKSPGFSNATRAAQAAGYRGEPGSNQLAVQGHANLHNPNVRLAIADALDKAGCSLALGARRLRQALDAKQVRPFLADGEVVYSKAIPDYRERRQATELLFRLRGAPMPVATKEEEHVPPLITEPTEKQREGFSETNEPLHLAEPIKATGMPGLLGQLRELNAQAQRLKEKAEREGDLRTALAAVRELCRIVELMAKLNGELAEGGETKTLNVSIDSGTAKRIVDTFLARHPECDVKNELGLSD
ncbi:MAG: terminase small subunit [Candidatus Acidiferrum sp.]